MRGRALRVVRLILRTPALPACFPERRARWCDGLAREPAERLGRDAEADLYPRQAAGMALNAFDALLRRWSADGSAESPADLTDRAFAVIAPALDGSRAVPGSRHSRCLPGAPVRS